MISIKNELDMRSSLNNTEFTLKEGAKFEFLGLEMDLKSLYICAKEIELKNERIMVTNSKIDLLNFVCLGKSKEIKSQNLKFRISDVSHFSLSYFDVDESRYADLVSILDSLPHFTQIGIINNRKHSS